MSANAIRRRLISTNGVELDVMEAGDPSQPTVILSHGFPEAAYSWRHQLAALADAGFHALAPDQRGYGYSSAPKDVEAYGISDLTEDLLGLLDAMGKDHATFVGHDWGAWIVWETARLHPERVKAVCGVSVPATDWPAPPTQLMRARFGDNFFYVLYFQEVGPAERELEADTYETVRKVFWGASSEGFRPPTELHPAEGTGFLTYSRQPPPLPWSWLTEEDVRHYADQFAHSGFFGPVSYYRNLDANYEVTKVKDLSTLTMPSYFITGADDVVRLMDPTGIERMRDTLPDYRGDVIIPGAGHWVQQEKPEELNAALLGFLRQL